MNKLTAGLGGYQIKSKDLAEKEGLVGIAKYRDLRRRSEEPQLLEVALWS